MKLTPFLLLTVVFLLIPVLTAQTPITEIDKRLESGGDAALNWRPIAVDLAPAAWIWLPSQRTLSNTFVLFRRDVNIDRPLKKATGWISADSRYLLTVNGNRVQWGLAPSDPRALDVDPIDLTAHLRSGQNVIGSEVLFYGLGDGTWASGKPGFLFYLTLEYQDGSRELIVSNSDWLTKLDRAHRPGQHKRWFLRALQEEFDARLHPHGWNTSDFKPDSTWLPAHALFAAPSKPPASGHYEGNDLVDMIPPEKSSLRVREIPLIQESLVPAKQLTEQGILDWNREPEDWFDMRVPNSFRIRTDEVAQKTGPNSWELTTLPNSDQGMFLTFEFHQQVVGFPYFTIEAPEGTIVELMVQESHTPGTNLWLDSQFYNWSRFVCREGVNHFQAYDFESLRWMQLHIRNADGPVKVSDMGVRRRLYDWPHRPNIVCSEPVLQRLFDASVNTLYNSCLDVCVDGMARERQQYSGDGGHQLLAVRSVLGETRLPKRFLRTFSEGQSHDGYFMDCWPGFDRLARVMQKQMDGAYWGPLLDHGIGFNFDCWFHYLETGDLAALEEVYPRLVRFADYLETLLEEDGLLPVEDLGIPTVWMDHIAFPMQRHKQCAFNLYAAAMLQHALAQIAQAKGDLERHDLFMQRGRSLLQNTIKKYWDAERRTFVNNLPWLAEEGGPRMDDRSLATAILFEQCPDGDVKESIRLLVESPPEMGYSYPCNACWRYWALCKANRSDIVLEEFRNRWGTMDSVILNNTLAEDWHASSDSASQWSHCAVSPLYVLFSDIAGIRPTSPGFRSVLIQPRLGDLSDLALTYHTPLGPIDFLAEKQGRGHFVTVKAPSQCQVNLVLPEGSEGIVMDQ